MIRPIFTAAAALILFAMPALAGDEIDPESSTGDIRLELDSKRPQARPDGLYENHVLAGLPRSLAGADDFTCLAVTIYHEARGESREGQYAVASVVLNRVAAPRWGDTICGVTVPVQFSYLDDDLGFAPITEYEAWQTAVEIATLAVVEGPDLWLEGADHYHTAAVNPGWNSAMEEVAQIGFHIFYASTPAPVPAS